ncbi:MAG: 3-dehydroquinate synthase [Sphingobacteriia bacterium]|nr:MAG: 3-dehydroquinate synthase [Sphingobacteriia bacterium]
MDTKTQYIWQGAFAQLEKWANPADSFLVTDENVFAAHKSKFKGWNTIVLKAGEAYKVQQTVDVVIDRLLAMGAHRQSTLVGVGGGVITDLTGYVAGIYQRGIRFGFVPTTLLSMVDAAIGGKNGVDVGEYKNMVGLIRQPHFLLYDFNLLKTLPLAEWRNGFAEIIKHAAIKDAKMFRDLQTHTLNHYRKNPIDLASLVKRNAQIKIKVITQDPLEQGERKLLNFGHTLGHAIENKYALSHGEAISIGMSFAAWVSAYIKGYKDLTALMGLLQRYGLPTLSDFDARQAFKVLVKDKKSNGVDIHFVLLAKTGQGVVQPLLLVQVEQLLKDFQKLVHHG